MKFLQTIALAALVVACSPPSLAKAGDYTSRAACLDPDAYEMHNGVNLDVVVPAGETWYAVNLWWVRLNGGGIVFHRHPQPLALPAGTRLTGSGVGGISGFAYICRPARVDVGDDPERLYERRMARLEQLPIRSATGRPYSGASQVSAPLRGERIIVVHVSSQDVAWTILCGRAGCINTTNEISDHDRVRFAEPVLIPSRPDLFDHILVAPAQTDAWYGRGDGTVLYKVLPADW